MIDKETLLKNGWKEKEPLPELVQYQKEINGFYYVLTDLRQNKANEYTGSWFDWECHVDNPTFETVACFEVDSLDNIDLIAQIYKK